MAAIDFQKKFILKTDAERPVPNALFYTIIDYMPDLTLVLKLKKKDYKNTRSTRPIFSKNSPPGRLMSSSTRSPSTSPAPRPPRRPPACTAHLIARPLSST